MSSPKSEPKRSRTCSVCKGEAETYHLNYGASACFSCRAFFRRCVQRGCESSKLWCKNGGNCVITVTSRRQCAGCRYQLCLKAGMHPNAVMSDSSKKVRFRKALKKQEILSAEGLINNKGRKNTPLGLKFPRLGKINLQQHENGETIRKLFNTEKDRSGRKRNNQREPLMNSKNDDTIISHHHHDLYMSFPPPLTSHIHVNAPVKSQSSSCNNGFSNGTGDCFFNILNGNSSGSSSQYSSPGSESINNYNSMNSHEIESIPRNTFKHIYTFDSLSRKNMKFSSGVSSPQGSTSTSTSTSTTLVSNEEEYNLKSIEDLELDGGDDEYEDYPFYVCYNLETTSDTSNPVKVNRYKTNDVKFRKRMMRFIEHMQRTWGIACKRLITPDDFMNNLYSYHLGDKSLSKRMLKSHVIKIAKSFFDYAYQQPEFVTLSKRDQRRLLIENTPYFIQFILAKYFTGKTGADQLKWITASMNDTNNQPYADGETRFLRMSLRSFNKYSQFFGNKQNPALDKLDEYQSIAEEIDKVNFKVRCIGLVGMACLYMTKQSTKYDDKSMIVDSFENVKLLIRWGHEVFDCPPQEQLLSVLENMQKMSKLFEANVNWQSEDDQNEMSYQLKKEVVIGQTIEEEKWTLNALKKFDNAYKSVSLGDHIVKDIIMHTFSVPVQKSFTCEFFGFLRERARRILKSSDFFAPLQTDIQSKLLHHSKRWEFISLMAMRVRGLPNGYEHTKFLMGSNDDIEFQNNYEHFALPNKESIKKISMTAIHKDLNFTQISKGDAIDFDRITNRMGYFFRDSRKFQLFSSYMLLDPNEISHAVIRKRVSNLKDYYLNCLQNESSTNEESSFDSQICHIIEDMNDATVILKRWFDKPQTTTNTTTTNNNNQLPIAINV